MKRYRDYSIKCNSSEEARALLETIVEKCKTDYPNYQTMILKDEIKKSIPSQELNKMNWIISNVKELPKSQIVLLNPDYENTKVSIVNIVPTKDSGYSHLSEETYNKILEHFVEEVINDICTDNSKYTIETNSEDYELEDLIPNSFKKLNTWINEFPLSSHPLDRKRWFDFVISLHQNKDKEDFSITDFQKWIQETNNWNEEVVIDFSIKLEEQLELLKHYDGLD